MGILMLWALGLGITIISGLDLIVNLIRFSQDNRGSKYTFWLQCIGLSVGIIVMKTCG